jgi:hypothetical protein
MRIFIALASLLLLVVSAKTASAWDGPNMWYDPANGSPQTNQNPGGGGILGTGGLTDHGITCANCHLKGKNPTGLIDAQIDFNPQLVAGAYTPGQTYTITVTMTGEHLGLSGCGQYTPDNNNFMVATLEDDNGNVAGDLRAASGSTTSCPPTVTFDPNTFKGTFMYADCHAVLSHGAGLTSWTFDWIAPTKGSGQVTLYYGMVDGNCTMDSLDDDVKVGTIKLGEATAMLDLPKSDSDTRLASAGIVPALAALAGVVRRRRRRRVE